MTFRDRISSLCLPPAFISNFNGSPSSLAAMSGRSASPRWRICSAAPRAMPPAAAPHGRAGLALLDGRGRAGRRSRLTLLDNQESLTRRRLRDLLSQGQLAQAVRLAEDRLDLLTPLLIEQLGQATTREGRQILRVPYYRPLPGLLPTAPLRRSRNSPEPPDLQRSDPAKRGKWGNRGSRPPLGVSGPCHWRFYLRPWCAFTMAANWWWRM